MQIIIYSTNKKEYNGPLGVIKMAIILPYNNNLGPHNGAFIKPDGEVLFIKDNKHEEFAEKYCNGEDFSAITGAKEGQSRSIIPIFEMLDDVKSNGLGIFRNSNLSREQLLKYKSWLERHHIDNKSIYADFLVYVLAFDKVETRINNLITTTSLEPHVRFFNYYLMDWSISVQKPLIYDEKEDLFLMQYDQVPISDYDDREAEEEITEIKAKVLMKDRPYFFK